MVIIVIVFAVVCRKGVAVYQAVEWGRDVCGGSVRLRLVEGPVKYRNGRVTVR